MKNDVQALVEQKVKTDKFILKQHEHKLKSLSKLNKQIDDRFSFLANPKKVKKEKSLEQKLDDQLEKILADKEKTQKRFSQLLKHK